ncbi:MAG: DUF302 domain-containing protein [Bacteroidetes bacterium]|nr:DUF302 domain-containing protein [Bacteroidota bacterium]
MALSFSKTVDGPFGDVVIKATDALKQQGFGVVTEIDFSKTMKEKLNQDILPYLILGVCNPGFAFQTMNRTPDTGLLMPCNVTQRENPDGSITVSAVNPDELFGILTSGNLMDLTADLSVKMKTALNSI